MNDPSDFIFDMFTKFLVCFDILLYFDLPIQVDIIKYISIPILKKFIVDEDVDLKVDKIVFLTI